MSDTGPARPRQVTLASVMATVSCVLLVFGLFDAMAAIGSTETQDSVRDFLATGPGGSLGLNVDGVTDILRGMVLFSGALAAAGVILAVYCLRRHRGARIGLSVVAVLMLFTTTFVAGLLPFVVALAASMLWRKEARDWFDGRAPDRTPRPSSSSGDRPAATMAAWTPVDPGKPAQPSQPAQQAQPGYGTSAPWPYDTPGADAGRPSAYAAPEAGSHLPGMPGARRPASVTAAVVLTWVGCALIGLLLALLVLFLVLQPDELVDELRRNPQIAATGYTEDQLLTALWVVAAIGIFWSLATMALGVLAFNGARAGQVGLLVSAVVFGILGVASVVVPVLAAVTVLLLLTGGSNRWFAARGDRRPPGDAAPPQHPDGKPPVW